MAAERPTPPLRQLFRLWWLYARLDLIWLMRDGKNFVSMYVAEAALNLATVSTTLLLTERFDGIGRWSKPQVLFMLGYAILAGALLELVFNFNVLHVSRRIGRGQLDHVLVQPQPLWRAFCTEGFVPFSGSGPAVGGVTLLAWAARGLGLPFSAGWLGLLALNLLASSAIILCFSFLWSTLAFWAPRAAEEVSSSAVKLLDSLKPFPLDGLGPVVLGGLMTVLPAGFVAWYPCRALLGIDGWAGSAYVTPGVAAVLLAVTALVFNRGLIHYGCTGSQRYLAHGHRR
jgi:ABC-2 type transport system permease protein